MLWWGVTAQQYTEHQQMLGSHGGVAVKDAAVKDAAHTLRPRWVAQRELRGAPKDHVHTRGEVPWGFH